MIRTMFGRAYNRHLAVAAVVGLLLAALVVVTRPAGPADGPEPTEDEAAEVEAAKRPAPPPTTSAWLGDDIVSGCCRTSGSNPTMARTAADALGWRRPYEDGAARTGYVTGGAALGRRPPLIGRLDRALRARRAAVVVLQGGSADFANPRTFDESRFRTAVKATFDKVRTLRPEAKLVVLGPYSPRPNVLRRVRAILAEEAAAAQAPFIDMIGLGWMVGHPELLAPNRFHPNDAGQVYLGTKMAEALRGVLAPELILR